ncbi:hypothetical protein UlMin_014095 [Ulmus minor]
MMGREGGRGIGEGGRDRFRREYPSRYEEETRSYSGSGRFSSKSSSFNKNNAPPSRHLWVGNLAHDLLESELTQHFLHFGDLESVAFHPGRSYAFLNFVSEDDAIDAFKALQGFPVAGNPLRIEFAKADKSSAPLHDEDHAPRRDERRSGVRESSFLEREHRGRYGSPDQFYADKSSISDKNIDPSPVLWIGFPSSLPVDEMVLRKAFSPFGEIEKITAFSGRSYAFVRFRSVMSACRAKDALHGKLFGNPRVHIRFAKSETGSSSSGRSSMNAPSSPNYRLNSRQGSAERISPFLSNLDSGESDPYSLSRNDTLWTGRNNTMGQRRFGNVGSDLRQDMYEYQNSPPRGKRDRSYEFSHRSPQTSSFYEETLDMPDDVHFFHGTKKQRTGYFPSEKELPEYPLSDYEQEKRGFPRLLSDLPQADGFHRKFDAGPYGYNPTSIAPSHGERSNDLWKDSYDGTQMQSGSLSLNPDGRNRLTPESNHSSLKDWKWEGTIAKGGTPVCRARCFPVGKVLDMKLPEFLDCTARTGLDMLSKHYYQAAHAWVVFFVPETDADIGYYNEFMNYLEDKQRAAVAKLDEKTTMFLVPPSNFSEKVLKVPGKLSISGVVLRLDHPSSNIDAFHHQYEKDNVIPQPASFSDSYDQSNREYQFHGNARLGPNWSSNQMQSSVSGARTVPSHASSSHVDPSFMKRTAPEMSSGNGTSDIPLSGNNRSSRQETHQGHSTSTASLQPEQLAQLASSLLGMQRQPGSKITPNVSMGNDIRQASTLNESENMFRMPQKYPLQSNQANSELSSSQFSQDQQLQQPPQQTPPNVLPPHMARKDHQTGAQGNQQLQNTTHEAETDPQNRLQATLQLAAALLQQIQGKGT